MALIGKWWWRFKIETNALWVKVIKSIYGNSGLLDSVGQPHSFMSNSTWLNIIKTGQHIDSLGVNFRSSFIRVIGDGSSTSFWNDAWITDVPLKVKFKRLARLKSNINATVFDRVTCDGHHSSGVWSWTRSPSRRTHAELVELNRMVVAVMLVPDRVDKWSIGGSGKFITKILFDEITSRILPPGANSLETMRNNFVPKKVEIFVWRTKRRRLPVLSKLDKRGIDLHSVRCPLCDDGIETVEHTLILCKDTIDLWNRVCKWWGMNNNTNLSISEAFCGNSPLHSTTLGAKIWQAVKWVCGYLIWKNRNQKVFNNKCWNPLVALNEIQLKTFDWIAKRCKTKKIDWLTWLNDPQSLLSSSS
ncbi:uncharacterized protein [Rutidosis leptorrhynchoides]|uniref:uncharacterized protein n=1 Tax=Rutidosis leptorrhynchoides TaxID=125765 RepID=UPI003A996AB4